MRQSGQAPSPQPPPSRGGGDHPCRARRAPPRPPAGDRPARRPALRRRPIRFAAAAVPARPYATPAWPPPFAQRRLVHLGWRATIGGRRHGRRAAPTRGDGVRRGDRRRRPIRPGGGDPAEAARRRTAPVCLVEKGGEIGAHILSGAVIEPRALNELIPDWARQGRAARHAGARGPVPVPDRDAQLHACRPRRRCTITAITSSRSAMSCRWLGQQAEELGVEIYPGFAAAELPGGRRPHRRHRHRRHGHRQGRPAHRTISSAAWNCAPTTRCSPRAAAARCPSS